MLLLNWRELSEFRFLRSRMLFQRMFEKLSFGAMFRPEMNFGLIGASPLKWTKNLKLAPSLLQ